MQLKGKKKKIRGGCRRNGGEENRREGKNKNKERRKGDRNERRGKEIKKV